MNFIAPRAEPLIREIPLSRLSLAPENVRKTPPDPRADAELKASIAALGLLENLVVRPDEPDEGGAERYAVVAGGRRLKAMLALNDAEFESWSPGEAMLEDRSHLSLDWLTIDDDGESFAALRALPEADKQALFAACVARTVKPQLAFEPQARPELEATVARLDIDFAGHVRPTAAMLWSRIAANIEQAIEAGSYEVGVETVIADSLAIAGRETLYEHPGTGAATELVEIVRRDRLVPLTAESALEIGARDPGLDGKPRLVVNTRSKRAAVLLPAPSRMLDDGGVQERVQLIRPATRERMAQAEFTASNWGRADQRHWRTLWDHEIGELPSHRESRFWLATGLLLPVWDRLPADNMRVRRLAADCGTALIGRVLDAEQVRAVRASFGLDGGPAMTGAEAFAAIMERGNPLALANGWRLARRRIMGGNRIEIEGPADTDLPALRRLGCTVEIVSFRARIFAPKADALERLLERWPLAA